MHTRGFTLIEMLIVITLMGLVAAAVATGVLGHFRDARCTLARTELFTLDNALDTYFARYDRYPDTAEGWEALVESKSIRDVPVDPWGRGYVYRWPGGRRTSRPDVGTYGADGAAGGEGEDADLFLGSFDRRARGCSR